MAGAGSIRRAWRARWDDGVAYPARHGPADDGPLCPARCARWDDGPLCPARWGQASPVRGAFPSAAWQTGESHPWRVLHDGGACPRVPCPRVLMTAWRARRIMLNTTLQEHMSQHNLEAMLRKLSVKNSEIVKVISI